MLNVPLRGWSEVLMHVDQDDVYDPDGDHGLSLYPHITVLYGVHQVENPLDMMLYLDTICRQTEIEFLPVSLFDSDPRFDVLKFGVNCKVLHTYHDKIKKKFPCTIDHEYNPHMTIAYINKGTGWKYSNLAFSMPKITIDLMRFTNADGHETLIKLKP
jgi:2'-5' RNA ligase